MTTLPGQKPEETRIGGYRLIARIGEGGMGVVHLAERPDKARKVFKIGAEGKDLFDVPIDDKRESNVG